MADKRGADKDIPFLYNGWKNIVRTEFRYRIACVETGETGETGGIRMKKVNSGEFGIMHTIFLPHACRGILKQKGN